MTASVLSSLEPLGRNPYLCKSFYFLFVCFCGDERFEEERGGKEKQANLKKSQSNEHFLFFTRKKS